MLDRLLVWGMNQLAPLLDPELLPELLGQKEVLDEVVALGRLLGRNQKLPLHADGSTGIGYRIE